MSRGVNPLGTSRVTTRLSMGLSWSFRTAENETTTPYRYRYPIPRTEDDDPQRAALIEELLRRRRERQ